MDYTIKFDVGGPIARHAIDSAVHGAVERFRDELGDNRELVATIAQIAATTALEQFKTWANAELRLIAAEHKFRADRLLSFHPPQFLDERVFKVDPPASPPPGI